MARHRLTPDIQSNIVAFILAGGYPEVAAEAAGIPRATFRRWMREAIRPDASPAVLALADAVRQAQAQARLAAETEIRAGRPLDWLKCGPGKDAPDTPGWTTATRPDRDADEATFLTDPQARALLAELLAALEPWPEARAAVASKMSSIDPQSRHLRPLQDSMD